MDVGDWLRGLGLAQYEAAFRDNEVDGKILPKLTAEDLKEMGVATVGHRRAIGGLASLDKSNRQATGGRRSPTRARSRHGQKINQ
jgi:hypothetical protein